MATPGAPHQLIDLTDSLTMALLIPQRSPLLRSIAIDIPTPTLASTPIPGTQAVQSFVLNHTVEDDCVPLLEECPICLDNYSQESCLRITNIPGCNHRVGANCLKKMLSSHPNEENKCPLCRTQWIAAPAPVARQVPRTHTARQMVGMFPDLDGISADITGRGVAGNTNVTANHMPPLDSTPGDTVVDRWLQGQNRSTALYISDSESDLEDNATQVREYQDFTRDIASIRARAQGRSRHRRQHSARHNSAGAGRGNTRAIQNGDSQHDGFRVTRLGNSPSRNGVATMNRILSRASNPFRSAVNAITPTIGASTPLNQVNMPGSSLPHPLALQRPVDNQQLRRTSQESSHTAAESLPVDGDFEFDEPIEVPQVQPQGNHDAVRARQLDQREIALSTRKVRLNQREANLMAREAALMAKEREQTQRQQTLEKMENLTIAQRLEWREMLRRHDEDLERVLS